MSRWRSSSLACSASSRTRRIPSWCPRPHNRTGTDLPTTRRNWFLAAVICGVACVSVSACGGTGGHTRTSATRGLGGTIRIDGAGSLYAFAKEAAAEFVKTNPNLRITVGQSGIRRGVEEFCAGEIDIANATRPLQPDEVVSCGRGGVRYRMLEVAMEAVAVVVNPATRVHCLSTSQLSTLWTHGSPVTSLAQLGRDPQTGRHLPRRRLSFYAPETDTGTFDLFTSRVNGPSASTRGDFRPSSDDDVVAGQVAGDKAGIGFVGFPDRRETASPLRVLKLNKGGGCISPSEKTIQARSYALSRRLFIYPSRAALATNPALGPFLDFVERNHMQIARRTELISMPRHAAARSAKRLLAALSSARLRSPKRKGP